MNNPQVTPAFDPQQTRHSSPPPTAAWLARQSPRRLFQRLRNPPPPARSGKLKALAVTSLQRSPAAPELPTLHEAGLTNSEMVPWHAVFAPVGTPPAVVNRSNREINAVLAVPENKKRLTDIGAEVPGGTPEDLARLLARDLPRLKAVVERSGAKID